MAKINKEMFNSDFYCTQCGNKGFPIMRKKSQQREAGHLKKLYCLTCKQEVNHAEIRAIGGYTYEDFKIEFELGRFKNGIKEPIHKLANCTNRNCKCNIEGKCWNSNYSEHCGHRPEEE